jgi:hypothetical protein
VENLSTVYAYPGMALCTPIIFLVRLATKFHEGKIILKISKVREELKINASATTFVFPG